MPNCSITSKNYEKLDFMCVFNIIVSLRQVYCVLLNPNSDTQFEIKLFKLTLLLKTEPLHCWVVDYASRKGVIAAIDAYPDRTLMMCLKCPLDFWWSEARSHEECVLGVSSCELNVDMPYLSSVY